jgi:nuclear pore complex protein Nup205
VGELEYKTNSEFRQCAERVSKALNLNELYAAYLVILALPQATRFDRSQVETAIYLHYSRRQYLVSSLLQIVRLIADTSTEDYIRKFLLDYVSRLCQLHGGSFPQRIVEAMKSGRDEIGLLDEAQRNRCILRETGEPHSDEDIRLRRKLVAQEVDTMGLILHGLVRLKFVQERDINIIVPELRNAGKLDILTMNLIAPTLSWIPQLCNMDDNVTADTTSPDAPRLTARLLRRIHELIMVEAPQKWNIPLLGAYIQMHWLSSLNGVCKLEDNAAAEFTYETDILEPSLAAVKSGGFDFAIKCILQPARTGTFTPPIRQEILQFLALRKFSSPAIDQFSPIYLSQDTKDLWTYQLEHLIQLFISHLADILKQIRLVEEDKALAGGSLFDYSEQSQQHPSSEERDLSLEVFFLLISQLYSLRPDSAESFLSDPDSALFGFLNWSSSVKPVSMLWTFTDMMASLSEGHNCSVAVDKLFSHDTSDQPRSKRFHQSWDLIFQAIQYYAENLAAPQGGNATGMGRQSLVLDRLEIDDETTVVLKSYLRLIRSVATGSHEVKLSLLSKNGDRVLSVRTTDETVDVASIRVDYQQACDGLKSRVMVNTGVLRERRRIPHRGNLGRTRSPTSTIRRTNPKSAHILQRPDYNPHLNIQRREPRHPGYYLPRDYLPGRVRGVRTLVVRPGRSIHGRPPASRCACLRREFGRELSDSGDSSLRQLCHATFPFGDGLCPTRRGK